MIEINSSTPVGQVHDLYKTNQVTYEGAVEALVGMGYKRRQARDIIDDWGSPIKSSTNRSEASFDRTLLSELTAWLSTDEKEDLLSYVKKNYDIPEEFNWEETRESLGDEKFYNEITKAMTLDRYQEFMDDYDKLFSSKQISSAKMKEHLIDLADSVMQDEEFDLEQFKAMGGDNDQEGILVRAALANMGQIHDPDFDGEDATEEDDQLVDQVTSIVHENVWKGSKPYTPVFKSAPKSTWKKHLKGLDKLERRSTLKEMYDMCHWEFLNLELQGTNLNDPENPMMQVAPDLCSDADDIRQFLLECARENLPGARENLKKVNKLLGIQSSKVASSYPNGVWDGDDVDYGYDLDDRGPYEEGMDAAEEYQKTGIKPANPYNKNSQKSKANRMQWQSGFESVINSAKDSKLRVNSNKQEDLAFIYKAIKQPSVIKDPQGPGQIGLVPFHEQLYVEGDNGNTVLIEECSDELIHQIARQVEIERPLGIHSSFEYAASSRYSPYFGGKPGATYYAGWFVDNETPWVVEKDMLNTGEILVLNAFATEAEAKEFEATLEKPSQKPGAPWPEFDYAVCNVLDGEDFDDLHAESLVSSKSLKDLVGTTATCTKSYSHPNMGKLFDKGKTYAVSEKDGQVYVGGVLISDEFFRDHFLTSAKSTVKSNRFHPSDADLPFDPLALMKSAEFKKLLPENQAVASAKRISSGWVGSKEGDHFIWTSSDGTLVIKPVGKFYTLYRNTDEYVDTFESLEDAQGAGDSAIRQVKSSMGYNLGFRAALEGKSTEDNPFKHGKPGSALAKVSVDWDKGFDAGCGVSPGQEAEALKYILDSTEEDWGDEAERRNGLREMYSSNLREAFKLGIISEKELKSGLSGCQE